MSDAAKATSVSESPLARARQALDEHRWADAVDLLDAAGAEGLTAADLDRYGEAAWWIGRLSLAIELRERAFAAHLAAGDREHAAGAALALANDYSHRLDSPMAQGWIRRAERLLEGLPESRQHAMLQRPFLNSALNRGDFDEAIERAERVLAIGERLDDRDLEALGLHDKGRALIGAGRVAEGMALLDEAVVAAVSGDVAPYPTAVVYCNATVACEDLTDYRRAGEFAEAAKRWCDRQAIAGFPGMCRVRRVEIIRLRGAWAEAEAEARQACDELQDFCLDYAGEGFYQIGEILLRRGDLEGADRAFSQAHQMGREPQPGLALLRHAQGRTEAGVGLLARSLADTAAPLQRARLLPAQVEVALASGDPSAAASAAEELRGIAGQYGTHVLRASADVAEGLLALAAGDHGTAIDSLRRAWRTWVETDAPYEAARARAWLAEAYVGANDPEAAGMELAAAEASFERLGAQPDVARAAALRRRAKVAATAEAAHAPRSSRAFMFTDIVRSTNLIEAIGDEAWGRLMAWHDDVIRALLGRHGGEEVDHAGDGFFVAFGSVDDAVGCARAIRSRLDEHRRAHGFAPSVRIGIHVAEAIQTSRGYEGRGVHVAARIGALAGPDEILVSRDVIDSAETPPAHGEMRMEQLRGISDPVEVSPLV